MISLTLPHPAARPGPARSERLQRRWIGRVAGRQVLEPLMALAILLQSHARAPRCGTIDQMDWNAVVTVQEEGFGKALQMLRRFGNVRRTEFFNVLVMTVDDPARFLDDLEQQAEDDPRWEEVLSRVVAGGACFSFTSPADFEEKAIEAVQALAPQLAGKSFHIRVHRRGMAERMSSQREERAIADGLIAEMERVGAPAQVTFEDPDVIVVIETVGDRACVSTWTREDQRRYRFLRLD